MQVEAIGKYIGMSQQKVGLVCDLIRGKKVDRAREILSFSPKAAAKILKKVLDSAIANAENNFGADIDELTVFRVYADQGPSQKRMHARAKGRGSRILKPSCHITVILSDERSE